MKKALTCAVAIASVVATMVAGLAIPAGALAANTANTDFAGYDFANYVAVPAIVSATVVMPKLKCTAGPERDIWPGVGITSVNSFAGMDIFCKNGKAHYYPFIEVQYVSKVYTAHTAHRGDKIAFKLTESTANVTATVVDETHKFTVTQTGAGSGTGYGLRVGDSSVYEGTRKFGVPNFGTLTFSHALANGSTSTPGPFKALGPSGFNMVTGPGTSGPVQVKTNPFASNGETFATVFKHS